MEYKLSCGSLYEDETYCWFSELQFNAFYRVEKATMKPEFLFHFPEEALTQERLFGKPEKVGDWLVFSPVSAKNIVLYNLRTKEVKTLPLKKVLDARRLKFVQGYKFANIIVKETIVYLIPSTYPAIVKLDLSTMSIKYLDQWVDKVENVLAQDRNVHMNAYFTSGITSQNKILLPFACVNQLCSFNTEKESFELLEIKGDAAAFNGIAFDGFNYWLTPKIGATVTKWNPETGETQCLELENSWPDGPPIVQSPLIAGNKLQLMAGIDSRYYEVNVESGEIFFVEFVNKQMPKKQELPNFPAADMLCTRLTGNQLLYISGKTHDWYTANLETKEVTYQTVWADKVGNEIMAQKTVTISETFGCGLQDFFAFVSNPTHTLNKTGKIEETIGQKILKATT